MKKRIIALILSILIFCFVFEFVLTPHKNTKKADGVVVLGYNFFHKDKVALDRYTKAVADYINNNPGVHVVILSGGKPNKEKSEALIMFESLMRHDLNRKPIIVIEDKSNTTRENIKFSAGVLKSYECKKVVIFGDVVKKPKALIFAQWYGINQPVFYGVNFWPQHRNTF